MAIVVGVFIALVVIYFIAMLVVFQLIFRRFTGGRDPFHALTHSAERVNSAYPKEMGAGRAWIETHEAQDVSITSYDGLTLRGKLYEAHPPRGIVVACHGYHSNPERDFSPACDFYYSRQHLSILLIDQRAWGKSEGKYITFGIKERLDVQDWCQFAAERFPGLPVILAGLSMGTSAILMATPELPEAAAAIVADCGYVSPWEELRHVVRHYAHLPAMPVLQGLDFWCRLLAGFSLQQYTTVMALAECHTPVLLVHGEADDFVPCSCALENRDACSAPTELLTVPGAGHGLSYLVDKDGYEAVLDAFLAKYIPWDGGHPEDSAPSATTS